MDAMALLCANLCKWSACGFVILSGHGLARTCEVGVQGQIRLHVDQDIPSVSCACPGVWAMPLLSMMKRSRPPPRTHLPAASVPENRSLAWRRVDDHRIGYVR